MAAAARRVAVGCLSNTNAVHWDDGLSSWPLLGLFDHVFLSFQIGLLKPDREVFEHVQRAVGTDPGRILFLDDNVLNIEAAGRYGLQALRARGVEETRRALVATGVLGRGPT